MQLNALEFVVQYLGNVSALDRKNAVFAIKNKLDAALFWFKNLKNMVIV